MLRRVSSAISVRTATRRWSGSSVPATEETWFSCASPNHPPASIASLRTRCRPGAAWVTISWAWAKRPGSSAIAETAASTCSDVNRRSATGSAAGRVGAQQQRARQQADQATGERRDRARLVGDERHERDRHRDDQRAEEVAVVLLA